MLRHLLLFLLLLALAGCGKKGALVPPEALAPAAVSDLAVRQRGQAFQVSWTAPGKEEGGVPLARGLAGFLLLRRTVLPPDQDCEECAAAYAELRHVDLEYLQDVRKIGSLLLLEDPFIQDGETYQYQVIALQHDGTRSRESNKPRRTAFTAPPPPLLHATGAPGAITLEFSSPPLSRGTFLGYNVYRGKKGEPDPIAPLNASPIAAASYQDDHVQAGVVYRYLVRGVASIDGVTVESAGSNPAEASLLELD